MSQRYRINGLVSDGVFYTGDMSADYTLGTFSIAFFDVGGNIVTPTAGTINHRMETIPGQWHQSSSGEAPINAIDCGSEASYQMPVYNGPAIKGRLTLTGVTGAVSFQAEFFRAKL